MPIYMRVDKDDTALKGDVLRKGQRWTLIDSFSYGPSKSFSETNDFHDMKVTVTRIAKTIYVTLPVTANSQPLFRLAAKGAAVGDVIIEFANTDGSTRGTVTLHETIVVNSQFGQPNQKGEQTQTLTLSCTNVEFGST
jgi:hypothetical protein